MSEPRSKIETTQIGPIEHRVKYDNRGHIEIDVDARMRRSPESVHGSRRQGPGRPCRVTDGAPLSKLNRRPRALLVPAQQTSQRPEIALGERLQAVDSFEEQHALLQVGREL